MSRAKNEGEEQKYESNHSHVTSKELARARILSRHMLLIGLRDA